ncbi:MAG: glycosyltransferase family 4 protein [Chloroflexota bacterium]|nr:glycosyltransferase family 4 protein [Chloroflexota bacterium]
MRILHLIDHFNPVIGYQETYLAREQEALGHEVTVISSGVRLGWRGIWQAARQPELQFSREEGILTCRLPVLPAKPMSRRHVWMLRLKEALYRIRPDVVHCHDTLSVASFFAALWQKEIGYVLIYDSHRTEYNTYQLGKKQPSGMLHKAVYAILARTLARVIPVRADAMVAIGEPEQDFLCRLYQLPKDAVPIIRLGADRNRFSFSTNSREEIRSYLGWDKETVVLGHAGTLRPTKGIHRLIEAMGLLDSSGQDVRALIVGRANPAYLASLWERVEALHLKSCVAFEEFAPLDKLPRLFSAMDIAVWPGDISITAIEAMSVGLPVIACRTPYTESVIEQYGAGILLDTLEVDELKTAVETLVRKPTLRLVKGECAKAAVVKELNWRTIAQQFLDLYQEKLEAKRNR